jgi:hypothetical protein
LEKIAASFVVLVCSSLETYGDTGAAELDFTRLQPGKEACQA